MISSIEAREYRLYPASATSMSAAVGRIRWVAVSSPVSQKPSSKPGVDEPTVEIGRLRIRVWATYCGQDCMNRSSSTSAPSKNAESAPIRMFWLRSYPPKA